MALPKGVAVRLGRRQQIVFNYHYINATVGRIEAEISLDLYAMEASQVEAEANIAVVGTLEIEIPPLGTRTVAARCAFERALSVATLTPHTHKLGTRVTVDLHRQDQRVERILESRDWRHPASSIFQPPLSVLAGESLRVTCTYENSTNKPVRFGPTSEDEMCFVFGYVYPAAETLFGLDDGGSHESGCVIREGL